MAARRSSNPRPPARRKRRRSPPGGGRRSIVVAIDGPAGSGKSTVAKGVALRLGLRRLDTGAMYRAVTLRAIRRGVDPGDGRSLARLAREMTFSLRDSEVLVDGKRTGRAIRRPEVSSVVSTVAAHPAVRRELVLRQREIIGAGGVVVEGRDIGTVVCPGADVKIFLTASGDERARRRHRELAAAGVDVRFAQLKREQARRDALDSERRASPLHPARDALVLDSTGRTAREMVDEVVGLALEVGTERKVRGAGARRR